MSQKNKRNTKKRKLLLSMILLFLFLAALGGYKFFMQKEETNNTVIVDDQLPDTGSDVQQMSSEDLQKYLQDQADSNYLNIRVNSKIDVKADSEEAQIEIVNTQKNVYPISVIVTLDDTDEVIYESGAIRPTEYIQTGKLLKKSKEGTYPITFNISIYDNKKMTKIGETQVSGKVVVRR
ncbi:hypothetical protein ACWOFR_04165 [Carnobacterium gallinarum]|uniref:hypothetical protein n=1 Tax=Carnobacterium gallinarum TaxID=2749 RepID=UPI0005503E6C|nr:hypothetical protein [Carnobacterium gallinarum]